MIVLKEVYLASWSKCLFKINSLFLKETSGHKSCFILLDTSVSYISLWRIQYSFLLVWELHPIHHSSILSSRVRLVKSSTYPSLLHSTLKVGTHFTLGKVSIHQEFVHHVIPCRTQISSAVTPPEVEYYLPSSFCTGGSMLDIYWSIEYVMS